jgi:hypothetical protein
MVGVDGRPKVGLMVGVDGRPKVGLMVQRARPVR